MKDGADKNGMTEFRWRIYWQNMRVAGKWNGNAEQAVEGRVWKAENGGQVRVQHRALDQATHHQLRSRLCLLLSPHPRPSQAKEPFPLFRPSNTLTYLTLATSGQMNPRTRHHESWVQDSEGNVIIIFRNVTYLNSSHIAGNLVFRSKVITVNS